MVIAGWCKNNNYGMQNKDWILFTDSTKTMYFNRFTYIDISIPGWAMLCRKKLDN